MMRALRSMLLAGAACCSVLVPAGGAWAQAVDGATSPQPAVGASAQDDTARAGSEDTQSAASTGDIVVTGIRASLERAQDIRRQADAVVSAVTLEDLGKFTDVNLADALQRVPGIQVSRNDTGDTGDRVSIRGLGPQFVGYTVNGRVVFGTGTGGNNELRAFNFDILPPEIIAGLIVHKTPSADDPQPGLAGQIDVQTLKPLSSPLLRKERLFASITARADYNEFADKPGPRISGVIGGKFADDTVGFYLSGLYADVPRQNSQYLNPPLFDRRVQLDTNGNRVADAGDQIVTVDAPQGRSQNLIKDDQKRLAFGGGLQWQASDALELYADGFWTRFNSDGTRNRTGTSLQDITVQGTGGQPGALLDPKLITIEQVQVGSATRNFLSSAQPGAFITTINGANTTSGTNGPNATSGNAVADQLFLNKSTLYVFGGGFVYSADQHRVSADAYYNRTEYVGRFVSWNIRKNIPVALTGFDERPRFPKVFGYFPAQAEPAGYFGLSGSSSESRTDIDTLGARMDYRYDADLGVLKAINLGVQVVDTEVDRRASRGLLPAQSAAVVNSPNYLPAYLKGGNGDRFFPGYDLGTPRSVVLDIGSLIDAFPIVGARIDELGVDPRASFVVTERSYAGYAQADLDAGALTGNIGVRLVKTEVNTRFLLAQTNPQGFITPGTTPQLLTTDRSDWKVLPSMNLKLALGENAALRLAASRVVTRPEPADIAPTTSINGTLGITPTGVIGVTQGNPNLKPYTADQLDLTAEFYLPHRGAIIGSVFYKDVKNFIARRIVTGGSPVGLPPVVNGIAYTYDINTPINLTAGQVFGVEIGFDQPLWGPLDGFGLQANYTYVDTQVEQQLGVDASGIPGASKHNVNAGAYFEKYGLSAQLTMTYRSDYLRNLAGTGTQTSLSRFTEGQTFVNFNGSYRFTENFEVIGAVLNLTNEVRRDYTGTTRYYLDGFTNGRTFTLGLRYRM